MSQGFIDGTGLTPGSESCLIWDGSYHSNGYGFVTRDGRTEFAHRAMYVDFHGEIPDGTEIHHICENPACVNVDHLEAITRSEHRRRHGVVPPRWQSEKTHCPSGHEYNEENTYWNRDKRFCRACHRESERKRYERKRHADIH